MKKELFIELMDKYKNDGWDLVQIAVAAGSFMTETNKVIYDDKSCEMKCLGRMCRFDYEAILEIVM